MTTGDELVDSQFSYLWAYRTAEVSFISTSLDYMRACRNGRRNRLRSGRLFNRGGSSPLARTNFLVDMLSIPSYKLIRHQQTQRTPNYEPSYQAN